MIWAADTDLIKGTIGEQSGDVVGNDVVKRMLELHQQLWLDGLVPKANFADDASLLGSDFRAGKIGIFPSKNSMADLPARRSKASAQVAPLLVRNGVLQGRPGSGRVCGSG